MTPIERNEVEIPSGFAGMSSMVSDVDAMLAAARSAAVPPGTTSSPVAQPPATSRPSAPHYGERAKPVPPSAGSSPWTPYKWAVGTLILCVIGTMIYSEATKESVSAPAPSKRVPPAAPALRVPLPSSPERSSQRVREEKPPVGKDHILSRTQIQYCLAESIRLEAGQLLVHDTDNVRAVLQFNEFIDDYNSRCGEYRYHRSAMEAAKQDIERQRSVLEAEGLRRLQSIDIQSPGESSSSRRNEEPLREQGFQVEPPHERTQKEGRASSVGRSSASSGDRAGVKRTTLAASSPFALPSLLSVEASERLVVITGCLEGRYPALCKEPLLTPDRRHEIRVARASTQQRASQA